ncbi:MAG: alpha/beta fold hydrolase [Chloroflexota bacterium]
MIELERLLRVPYIDPEGGFDISPDGTRLAFAWNRTGAWEIYEMPLRGARDPWPVSRGDGAKLAPKYSPDGSRLAYVVDFDGGENYHIFVAQGVRRTFQNGQIPGEKVSRLTGLTLEVGCDALAVDLTPNITFTLQPNFCWSPDGMQIAFLADKTGCFAAYVMPASGGEPRLLLDTGFPVHDIAWSPGGRYLAVVSEADGQDFNILILPLDGSTAFVLADETGPLNAQHPAWSPDGTKLAFCSDYPNGFHQIGIFDLASRQISWLTAGRANCRSPQWSHDGAKLACIRAQGAADKIVVCPLADSARARRTLPAETTPLNEDSTQPGSSRLERRDAPSWEFQVEIGVHYKPHFTPDDKSIVFPFNNPRRPPDLWMADIETGELRQLTHSLSADVAGAPFILPKEITYPGQDGTPVPALLFKSPGADETTPAVVVIHGGPDWHFQIEWYPLMAHLASRGWTVLAPNYRGSTGYGRGWQYANRFDLGGVDMDDVAAGARYLLANKLADPQRIAVTGRSHGGYLTMTCLTRYPGLWRAGSAVVPFLNWFTAHENSRKDLQHWDIENFGDPVENHDRWRERSPFFFLDKIKAPVQLICGENDPRCPPDESIQARDKLREIGREVDFKLYEGEGHAFLKTENVVDAEVRRVNFLAKNLER